VHLRHRRSLDLDLFSLSAEVDLATVRASVRGAVPGLKVLSASDAALHVRGEQVPVDLVRISLCAPRGTGDWR
jgi:hypothetical protein